MSPLAGTNLSGATPFNITTTSSTQTAGAYKLVLADLVLTATGAFGPFRYIVIYNTTAASQQVLGWVDVGSEVSLTTGQTFTIDFDQTTGAITARKSEFLTYYLNLIRSMIKASQYRFQINISR